MSRQGHNQAAPISLIRAAEPAASCDSGQAALRDGLGLLLHQQLMNRWCMSHFHFIPPQPPILPLLHMRSRPQTLLLLLIAGQQVWSLGIPLPLRSPSPMLAGSAPQAAPESNAGVPGLVARRQGHDILDGPPTAALLAAPDFAPAVSQPVGTPGTNPKAHPSAKSQVEPNAIHNAKVKTPPKPKPNAKAKMTPKAKSKAKSTKGKDNLAAQDVKPGAHKAGDKTHKAKHRPGSHHKDDRVSAKATDPERGSSKKKGKAKSKAKSNAKGRDKGRGKGRANKQSKRYLSSNAPTHPKREMSLWDYDRHAKRMGPFDPLAGTGVREAHQYRRALYDATLMVSAAGPSDDVPVLSAFRQGVVLEHGQPHPGSQLASTDHTLQRRTLLNLGGLVTFDLFDDLGSMERRDDPLPEQTDPGQNTTLTPAGVVSVLDGGPRMYADKIIWQPTSNHPKVDERNLVPRRKSDDDEEEWEESRGGGPSGYEDSDAGKHGGGKGYGIGNDDEDGEEGDRRSHANSDSDGRRHGQAQDDDEQADDDDEYQSSSSTGGHAGKHGGDNRFGDDELSDGSRQHPASHSTSNSVDSDDEDDYPPMKQKYKPAFDDGQYRPWKAPGSEMNDCATLASFYTSMSGDSWTRDLGWSTKARTRTACCQWTGVTCDVYDRVVGVNLAGAGLEGALSDEIFSLNELIRL